MDEWKKIEAILFASGKYLTEEQIIVLAGISKNKIKKALTQLKEKYEKADTSLKLFNEQNAWKLNVKEEYTDVIREVVSDAEMPRAVMETLAVIAYKSPVLQSEIKDIRGTSVYDHIPLLEAKGFITRDKHGRSYKIKLTNKFHEYFDIDGDSKLAELFKDVKKPEKPTKLGELDVYDAKDEDDKFDAQILERMKKLEKTKEDNDDENKFLNEFEEKYEKTKKNIDESEQDIQSFRKKTDEDAQNIFDDDAREKMKETTTMKQREEEDDLEDANEQDELDMQAKNNKDEEISNHDEVDETQNLDELNELYEKDETKIEKEEENIPEFLKKVNKQIDELTEGRDYTNNDDEDDEDTDR